MSNLSELLPTGGGQNAVDFVASGTLSSGQTVVLNSDGTVSAVSGAAASLGSTSFVVDASTTINSISSVFNLSENKIVVSYSNSANSGYGTASVGTVSGTTISFGTPIVFNSSGTSNIKSVYDSASNKIITVYRGGTAQGTGIVGTVSGTSISFGSATLFETGSTTLIAATFDSNANKIVIAYRDQSNSNYSTAVVGTVSGTSISFGTPVIVLTTLFFGTSLTFDSNANKVVLAYRDDNNSKYGTAKVGTVSGTSISFGSSVVFNSGDTAETNSAFDYNTNKVVIAYRNSANSNYGTAVVGTVSGTSISFGSSVVFNAGSSIYLSTVYDPDKQKILIGYYEGNTAQGAITEGVVSGTSISFGSTTLFGETALYVSLAYDTTSNITSATYANGTLVGVSGLYFPASTNSADFIGITAEAISDTATGAVNVYGGINEAQTGLTIGSDYYVQNDGSLSTTASAVKVGQAISATTINMMDLT